MKYFWIILLAETISAQVPYFGSCPQLSVKDNFLLTNYSGVWYEAEKYPNTYDYFGRCVTQAIYQDEWNNWRIFNQQIIVVTNQEDALYGYLRQIDGAKLETSLPTSPFYSYTPYWVLSSDYRTYAVIYWCRDFFGLYHQRFVRILTRERHPNPRHLARAYTDIDDRGLERKHLRRTQQNGCEDYAPQYDTPPIDTPPDNSGGNNGGGNNGGGNNGGGNNNGGAIAFDYGATQVPFLKRCPKVSVQPNFQLDQYLGIWYEVEKYPTIFELGGKCITANYTRDWNGIVRVRNSQKMIITGKPVSIQGTASQVDGAKLQVSLEVIPGFSPSSPYWILSTDYDNYAVVWSCTDFLFASQRFLWILTRHPHPPVPVMEEVYRVLDYFQIEKSCLTRTDQNGCY